MNETDPERGIPVDINRENADWLRSPSVQGYDAQRKRAEEDERGLDGIRYTPDPDQPGDANLSQQEGTDGQG